MAKVVCNNLTTLSTGSSVTTLNNNFDAIETAMENTLSRDGTSPNHMLSHLDMNSYRIQNLVAAVSDTEPVRLAEMTTELAALETTVQTIATTTQGYLNNVISLYDQFDDRYLGNKASDPTTDNDGSALATGALYYNTTSFVMKVYNGSAWGAIVGNASGTGLDDFADVVITSATLGDVLRFDGSFWVDYPDSNFLARANHTGTQLLSTISDVTITSTNLNILDDGLDTTLHFHDSDRARANHTGTQLASTISDFTEAAQDAVGTAFDSTLVYTDGSNAMGRAAITGHITISSGSNSAALGSFTIAELNTAISDADALTVATAASTYQPLDADLISIAALTTTSYGRSVLELANAGAAQTLFGLVIGTNVQAFDADLTTWAGLTPSANHQTLVTQTFAQMRASLDLEAGTDFNAYSARLADVAGISWVQGDVMYFDGANLVRLAPGTSGHFLKTNGAAANPAWAAIAGGGDLLASNNLSDVAIAATAFANIKQAATDTATGVVELATDAEAITGTDTARAVTPASLAAVVATISGVPVGSVTAYVGATEPTGWLFLFGGTIGNASSGGSARANADTEDLFVLLWDSMADAQAAVSTGRGASAAADYAANKTITLPDLRGRVIAGQDDMGGTSANRLTGVTGSVNGDTLGGAGGTETHTLVIAEMPAHTHTYTAVTGAGTGVAGIDNSTTTSNTSSTGGDGAHNNVQPTIILNYIIKI